MSKWDKPTDAIDDPEQANLVNKYRESKLKEVAAVGGNIINLGSQHIAVMKTFGNRGVVYDDTLILVTGMTRDTINHASGVIATRLEQLHTGIMALNSEINDKRYDVIVAGCYPVNGDSANMMAALGSLDDFFGSISRVLNASQDKVIGMITQIKADHVISQKTLELASRLSRGRSHIVNQLTAREIINGSARLKKRGNEA